MALGPSRSSVYRARIQALFPSISLDPPTTTTQGHVCYWMCPLSCVSPCISSFLHLLLAIQMDPKFFINWVFFLFRHQKFMCECVSARTQGELLSFPSYSSSPNGAMSRDFLLRLLHTQLILTVCMTLGRKYCYSQKETYVLLVGAAVEFFTFYTCPLCIARGGFQIP